MFRWYPYVQTRDTEERAVHSEGCFSGNATGSRMGQCLIQIRVVECGGNPVPDNMSVCVRTALRVGKVEKMLSVLGDKQSKGFDASPCVVVLEQRHAKLLSELDDAKQGGEACRAPGGEPGEAKV